MSGLRVGISCFFQFSVFSNGYASMAFTLAETLAKFGYIPVLVNTNGTSEWFEDCHSLKDKYERLNLADINDVSAKLDLFIDIDGYIVAEQRWRIAKRVVVFIRKPVFIHEAEKTVYPVSGPVRNIRDCDAIWMWSELGEQDAHLVEILSEKPVIRLPFTWSETLVETYGSSAPLWSPGSSEQPWEVHIMESNQSVSSNITLPVVAMAYVKTHSKAPVRDVWIHNSEKISSEKFFQDNVYAHSQRPGLNFNLIGRQRITDWRSQSKSCCLTHTRFQLIKPSLLDAAWNGIPVIHSSPFLRDIGCGLEKLYYADNSIIGICKAFDIMNTGELPNLANIRSAIKTRLDPINYSDIWRTAIEGGPSISIRPSISNEPRILRIGFSDMWQDANCEYNFWTLLIQEAGKHMTPQIEVQGVAITDANLNERIDLLFFAPFGTTWTRVPSTVPKIHITGENSRPIIHNDVKLNFGFDATNTALGIYRFPLWIQYFDWFSADQSHLKNPRVMPVESIAFPSVGDRKKFCAFIVSNPCNQLRNSAFEWLNHYKPVDSGGRLFNNIGDILFVENAGGGGGELKKFEFLKDYKFCITFENSRTPGYVTEKLIAAKAAGCVPIYWGAEDVCQDFSEDSFINANNITCPDELISLVRDIDINHAAWRTMSEKPSVDIHHVRSMLATAARHILGLVFPAEKLSGIPRQLGLQPVKAYVSPFQEKTTLYLESPSRSEEKKEGTLLVTFATQKYIQSLKHWIMTIEPRREIDRSISARVYLGADVETLQISLLRADHSWIDFRRVPSHTPENFPDMWEPQHFAWKLWIYQELVRDSDLLGKMIWYMDSASIIVRWPDEWLGLVRKNSICMLEDSEQKNKWWCHETFCKELQVSAIEGEAQQIWAGGMAFVGGAVEPWNIFTEAWKLGQQRELIVGEKWSGIGADGHPFGHRHDQSILSLLRLRMNIPVFALERVYNHESLRRTFKAGVALYVHRGQIKENADFAPRISEAHIVSLARRADRIKRFKDNHERWTKDVFLRPAFDGKHLKMTKGLAQLFAPNDFGWKKPVMGCALSHLSLWLDLAMEGPACENYLILEDDVKLKPGWLERWGACAKEIPEDYDVLYLGGVLPPNRQMLDKVLEPVNGTWSRIAFNSIFGQNPPTRYFHFCTYAYIISRKGATKLLQSMQRYGGYHTSADHMMCNRMDELNIYVQNYLDAGCIQDDDPVYQKSSFNDFSRVDTFDSDLWNNTERFTEDEVRTTIASCKPGELSPLLNVLQEQTHATQLQVEVMKNEVAPLHVMYEGQIFTTGAHSWNPSVQPEHSWLREIIGPWMDTVQNIPLDHMPLDSCPIFIVCRPHMADYLTIFNKYEALGKPFRAIHISDEYCADPIEWYSYSSCKGVLRNYPRIDCSGANVMILPLGPNRRSTGHSDKREFLWSFYGTKWMGREAALRPLMDAGPNSFKFYDDWMDPNQLGPAEYSAICSKSLCIPCPRGQNAESFRVYEALDFGCLPLIVRDTDNELYYNMLSEKLHLPIFSSWTEVRQMLGQFIDRKMDLDNIRRIVLAQWSVWKTQMKDNAEKFLSLEN
jgi:GR25 family glycosyltransferase involved in LPS biosynthesis